jgi:hypothetical protein
MAENGTKSITFPATNAAGEAKLKRLIETIADYMGAKVTLEIVMVMEANYPSDRSDIEAIFKRLAGNKTGFRTVAPKEKNMSTQVEEPSAEE